MISGGSGTLNGVAFTDNWSDDMGNRKYINYMAAKPMGRIPAVLTSIASGGA